MLMPRSSSWTVATRTGGAAGGAGTEGRPPRRRLSPSSSSVVGPRRRAAASAAGRGRGSRATQVASHSLSQAAAAPYDKALRLRDAVLVSFLCVTPARVGVVRRLRIGHTLRRDGGAWAITLLEMRAPDGPSERAALVSKTAKSHGAVAVALAAPLQELVTAYVETYRRLLLPASASDQGYLFFNASGAALSGSGWAAHVKRVMARWAGVPVPASLVRAIIETFVRDEAAASRIEGETAQAVIEGTARLLAHTPKTATLHYDCNARARQAAAAVAYYERLTLEHDAARAAARLPPASAPPGSPPPAPSSPGPPSPPPTPPGPPTAVPVATPVGGPRGARGSRSSSTPTSTSSVGSDELESDGSSDGTEPPRRAVARGPGGRFPWQKRRLDPGDRLELELAKGEGRWCGRCDKILKSAPGARSHRASCGKPGRGRRRGRGRGVRTGDGAAEPEEGDAGAAVRHHLRWISASPFPASQVVAAIVQHAADPLPRTVYARLVGTTALPSGEFESRLVLLRRFGGAFWTPSGEGGPDEWAYPRAVAPVEHEAKNGALDITTGAERVADLLGLGGAGPSSSRPPPPSPSVPKPTPRGRGEARGRPPRQRGAK